MTPTPTKKQIVVPDFYRDPETFLRAVLPDEGGPDGMKAGAIIHELKKHGHSVESIFAAVDRLGVESRKVDGKTWWRLWQEPSEKQDARLYADLARMVKGQRRDLKRALRDPEFATLWRELSTASCPAPIAWASLPGGWPPLPEVRRHLDKWLARNPIEKAAVMNLRAVIKKEADRLAAGGRPYKGPPDLEEEMKRLDDEMSASRAGGRRNPRSPR